MRRDPPHRSRSHWSGDFSMNDFRRPIMRRIDRSRLLAMGALLATLFVPAQVLAQTRTALVIGNSNYRHAPALPNPINDATAIADLLRHAGFDQVALRHDLGIAGARNAVRELAEVARTADTVVVFFAGHGIEVDGVNYLIPTDARLASDFDVEDEAISLDRILRSIEPARKLRLVILDACRDNPFVPRMRRMAASRAIGRGLARVEPPVSDTLIAYSTRAGSIAADGRDRHSPFTGALLKHLTTPELDLRIAFGHVRDEVRKATNRQQEPYMTGSLGGDLVSLATGHSPKVPAGPSIASAPLPPPTIGIDEVTRGRIARFIEWEHLQGRTNHYAARVDYFSKGVVTRDVVLKDIAAHNRNWPRQNYALIPGTLSVISLGNGQYSVTFGLTFENSNAQRTVRGQARKEVILAVQGGQFIITSVKETVQRQ